MGAGLERVRAGQQPQHRAAVHALRAARALGQRNLVKDIPPRDGEQRPTQARIALSYFIRECLKGTVVNH